MTSKSTMEMGWMRNEIIAYTSGVSQRISKHKLHANSTKGYIFHLGVGTSTLIVHVQYSDHMQ